MKELLLLLSGYPHRDSKLCELIKGVDWHKAIELINAHGITALAYYNIMESGCLIPENKLKILEHGHMQSVVRNTWLTHQWKQVNTILNHEGIRHILLKGMALEHTLYGSRGLRQMNDNDILIERKNALKAWYLLQENGFKPSLLKSPLHKKILLDIGKHLPCLYKDGYAVEIHHSVDPFNGAREISVSGTRAFILSEENQLNYLINHFYGHIISGHAQIRQYADIMLLDKNTSVIMPEEFIMNPDQSGNRKAVYKNHFRSIPTGSRLRYLIGDIFPSATWMRNRYKSNWLLYYPVRVGKIVWILP